MKHLKKYVKPEMQTVLLHSSQPLLAGSATTVIDEFASPGDPAMAPGDPIFDNLIGGNDPMNGILGM